jgi:hypothetical protein
MQARSAGASRATAQRVSHGILEQLVRRSWRKQLVPHDAAVLRAEGADRLYWKARLAPPVRSRRAGTAGADRLGRAAGFSLEEIALMFAPDGQVRIDRQMLTAKAEELERTISKLSTMREGLRHAAACPAPSHMECPNFRRRYLQSAAARTFTETKRRPNRQR